MNFQGVLRRFWAFGLLAGLLTSVVITAVFTTLDWIRNYGELFRDETGTHWNIVFETATSWALPTFLYVTVIAAVFHLVFNLLRRLLGRSESN